MNWLIGVTGYSFFDWWTLVHFCFWTVIGSCLWALKIDRPLSMLGCITVALMWEIAEIPLAEAYPDKWLDPESWWNSWISDPLTCIVALTLIWTCLDNRRRATS